MTRTMCPKAVYVLPTSFGMLALPYLNLLVLMLLLAIHSPTFNMESMTFMNGLQGSIGKPQVYTDRLPWCEHSGSAPTSGTWASDLAILYLGFPNCIGEVLSVPIF